jgi:hypothetical protein
MRAVKTALLFESLPSGNARSYVFGKWRMMVKEFVPLTAQCG